MINVIVTRSMVYGCLLMICRKCRKLKQVDLADAIYVGASSLSRYELGDSELTINYLHTLTMKLEVSLIEFVTLAEFIISDLNSRDNVNIAGATDAIRPRIIDLEIILSNQYKQHLQDLLEG